MSDENITKDCTKRLSESDIKDLPLELVEQLSVGNIKTSLCPITSVMKNNGGAMSIDHILIALYKQTKIVHKRKILTAKLYRLEKKKIIKNEKCGVYSIIK